MSTQSKRRMGKASPAAARGLAYQVISPWGAIPAKRMPLSTDKKKRRWGK